MTLSGQGYTATALTLRDARLALTEDLNTRGVQLPGATVVTVRTTEPALVTLYRATGNSTGWQRFCAVTVLLIRCSFPEAIQWR